MILIKKDNKNISFKGHANYTEENDIVCASVSSIMYTTVNALLRYDENCIKYEDNNTVNITINKNDEIIDMLIINMMSLLNELSEQYPKNIRVEMEE